MKKIHLFEIGELCINRNLAEKLRENILLKAKEHYIGTNPIQYERLLKDIKFKLIELMKVYEFQFEGNVIDFTRNNPVMFTSRVLKRLFSDEDKTKDIITLQTKNLDILSFYAYDKPWNEIKNNYTNTDFELYKYPQPYVEQDVDGISKIVVSKNLTKKFMIIFLFLICIAVIIMLIFKNNSLKEKSFEINQKYKQLQEEYLLKFNKYQSTLRWYNKYFYLYNQIDNKYYDTLKIPTNYRRIFIMQFTTNPSYKFKDNINVEVLKSNNKFKSEPGIKDCDKFGGTKAFGFGRTYCKTNCYEPFEKVPYYKQPNCVIYRINFHTLTDITYISFQWVEINGNWGSSGNVFINGGKIGFEPYQFIGNWPNSNLIKDETVRNFKCSVNAKTKYLDIAVQDIADESEIFIDNIEICGKK